MICTHQSFPVEREGKGKCPRWERGGAGAAALGWVGSTSAWHHGMLELWRLETFFSLNFDVSRSIAELLGVAR